MEYEAVGPPLLKIIIAIILGGLIGLERELASKPAGLRTHMLVTGVATLLVVLGDFMIQHYGESPYLQAVMADPIRIMEAIITGISFLGAGTIIFRNREQTVEGLTTAASILFASAIGMTVALEQYFLAVLVTILVMLILIGLGYIESFLEKLRQRMNYKKEKREDL